MTPCEGCPLPHICVLDGDCAEGNMPRTLADEIREAQAEIAKWPKWKRDACRLEGDPKYNFPSSMGQ